MKQLITADQLQELTPSQQDKLKEWWKPKPGDHFVYIEGLLYFEHFVGECGGYWNCERAIDDGENPSEQPEENSLPLLSIGQCIELLDNLTEDANHKNEELRLNVNRSTMWIGNTKLIDQLWDAIKSIL